MGSNDAKGNGNAKKARVVPTKKPAVSIPKRKGKENLSADAVQVPKSQKKTAYNFFTIKQQCPAVGMEGEELLGIA